VRRAWLPRDRPVPSVRGPGVVTPAPRRGARSPQFHPPRPHASSQIPSACPRALHPSPLPLPAPVPGARAVAGCGGEVTARSGDAPPADTTRLTSGAARACRQLNCLAFSRRVSTAIESKVFSGTVRIDPARQAEDQSLRGTEGARERKGSHSRLSVLYFRQQSGREPDAAAISFV